MSTYGNQEIPFPLRVIRGGFKTIGALSPRLAGKLAYQLFQTPIKRSPVKAMHQLMRQATEEQLPFENGHIATYRWAGSGPAVLLVHGWEANASRWLKVVAALREQDCDVIAFDAPAHGKSTGRRLPFERYAAAIAAVNNHFNEIEAIMAHSFGVVASAYYLSEAQPDNIRRVVFVAGPDRAMDVLEGFADIIGLSASSYPFVIESLVAHAGRPAEEISVAHIMKNSSLPGLICHDEADDIVAYEGGVRINAVWPNSRLYTTHGMGHRKLLSDPELLSEISHFLTVEQASRVLERELLP